MVNGCNKLTVEKERHGEATDRRRAAALYQPRADLSRDPRRFAVVEPPPFAPQILDAERSNAIDLALDRLGIHRSHG